MNTFFQHPSTRLLLRHQRKATVHRMIRGFRSPRRLLLSAIAIVLTVLWVGQAIAGVFFRETADRLSLLNWLTLGLTAYAVWNLLKVVFRKPVEPFEWTAAETEWLRGAPLTRGHLVRYRLASISAAAFFKAGIFTLVMIPDLHLLPLAFLGAYAGLMLIELIRSCLEIIAFGMTHRERMMARVVVGAVAAVGCAAAGNWLYGQWQAGQFTGLFSVEFIQCVTAGLREWPATALGSMVCGPSSVLATIIVSDSINAAIMISSMAIVVILFGMKRVVEILDNLMNRRLKRIDRINFERATRPSPAAGSTTVASNDRRNRNGPRCRKPMAVGGMGGLIWRQLLGVKHYRGTVLISLLVPLILALAPVFGNESGWKMVERIIVMIACYSFLLLPTALKFDFRRDLDRINVLKSLPIHPLFITMGQLAVPVLVTSVFQLFALAIAMAIKPFHPGLLVVSMAVLIPVNVFIYALENLMFLLYPYRINGEGIQVFLRTILAFTAKGILMLIGLALGLFCMLFSTLAGNQFASPEIASLTIFATFACLGGSAISAAVVSILSGTFKRLDPSRDLASIQLA